ncbi:MAG TPA: hypothetical protein PKN30_07875, partial [Flavobacteriales bacterium]|nr:hypothetical protein [Flavobacteriales bacterium]
MSAGHASATQQATAKQAEPTAQGKAFDLVLFNRVFAFTKPYRGIFWLAVMLTFVLSIVGVLRPIMLGWLVDVAATAYDQLFVLTDQSNWNAHSIAWAARVTKALVGPGSGTLVWVITLVVVVLLVLEALV